MVAAALADGTADAAVRVRGLRPAAARRPPLRRGRRHRAAAGRDQPVPVRRRRSWPRCRARRRRPRHARLARRLPVHRRHRRLPRGRAVLPRLADPHRDAARSPSACVLETLALSILNHDSAVASAAARMVTAAAGPAAHRDGVAAHPRGGRGRRGPGGLPGRASRPRRTWRPAAATASRPTGTAAHAFMLLHDDELTRVPRARSTALGAGHHAARRHLRHPPRASRPPSRSAGPGLGAVRIDSGDLGVLARQARDQLDALGATGHPDRRLRRPRRVRDRRAARRARRLLRRRHLGGHRLGRADRGHGLQAGRGRRAAGGQAQRGEGVARRPQVGGAPAQADRHGDRGGRAPRRRRRPRSARTTACCRCR